MFALGLGLQYILGKYIVFKLFCKKFHVLEQGRKRITQLIFYLGVPNLDIGNSQHSTTIFLQKN